MDTINYLYNLFYPSTNTSENITQSHLNLLEDCENDNNYMCSKVTSKNKESIDYIPDFIDFNLENERYFFKIGTIKSLKKIPCDFYRNKYNKNIFYLKTTQPYYFSDKKEKIYINAYNIKKETILTSAFNYKVNDDYDFINDCIYIEKSNFKLYLFITRKTLLDDFYIKEIIYYHHE